MEQTTPDRQMRHPRIRDEWRRHPLWSLCPLASLALLFSLLHWAARLDVTLQDQSSPSGYVHHHAGLFISMSLLAAIPSATMGICAKGWTRFWGFAFAILCVAVGIIAENVASGLAHLTF